MSVLARLNDLVDEAVAIDDEELDETQLRTQLSQLDRAVRRLRARCDALASTLAARRTRTLRDAGDARARQRAKRQTVDELRETLGWTAQRTNAALRTTDGLAGLPATTEALAAGDLSTEHARPLIDALRHVTGDVRRDAEARLLEAAKHQDPVAFGRSCRRLVASLDEDAAEADHERRRARRFCRTWTDELGMTRISAAVTGIDAETLLTSLDAFRTLDPPGEVPRAPEQRTADALVAMARAALDHGLDATDHGNRPHVIVVRRTDGDGTAGEDSHGDGVVPLAAAEGVWTGPLPRSEVERLSTDASVSTVELDANGAPVRSSDTRRTVAPATWRALVARDGGCTFPGCDAPPAWCDAAHTDVRFADGAGSSVHELALACRSDHRTIDRLGLIGRLVDGRIRWFRPDGSRYEGRAGPTRAGPGPP